MDREDGLIKERPGVVLLSHIYEVWPDGTKFLPTAELIDLLVIAHPSMWGDGGPYEKRLTAKRLGRMLSQSYKIHSEQPVRGGPRGYFHSHFLRPWHRMKVTLGGPPRSDASDASGASDEETASDTSATSGASDTGGPPGEPMQPGYATCSGCNHRFFATDGQDLCPLCDQQREEVRDGN
jgi:hypothetical protein